MSKFASNKQLSGRSQEALMETKLKDYLKSKVEGWLKQIERKEHIVGAKKLFQAQWLLLHCDSALPGVEWFTSLLKQLKYETVVVSAAATAKAVNIFVRNPMGRRMCYVFDMDAIGRERFPTLEGDTRAPLCFVSADPYKPYLRKLLYGDNHKKVFTVKLQLGKGVNTIGYTKPSSDLHHTEAQKDRISHFAPWDALRISEQYYSQRKWQRRKEIMESHGDKLVKYWWTNMYIVPTIEDCEKQTAKFSEMDVFKTKAENERRQGNPVFNDNNLTIACTLMQLGKDMPKEGKRKAWKWNALEDPTRRLVPHDTKGVKDCKLCRDDTASSRKRKGDDECFKRPRTAFLDITVNEAQSVQNRRKSDIPAYLSKVNNTPPLQNKKARI